MKYTLILRYFLVLLAVFIGMVALITPKARDDDNHFSAERAFEDIEVIAQLPHTVEDPIILESVRDYLFTRMRDEGLKPLIHTYPVTDDEYNITEVNNILGVIPGVNNSYILLVAHYDSGPAKKFGQEEGSLGAADDGYGLSSILETINQVYDGHVPLRNGIKVIFTDAEEIGLLGIQAEIDNYPGFFENVAFVINVEARGVKGPSIMFQSSLDNYKVIKFYQQANYPVSFSLAGDVYSRMPNYTDFTPLLEIGVQGINMAVLDNLDYYHTPMDNPDNVNLSSLQHYGEVLVPLVKEFINNDDYSDVDYFQDSKDAMYFTFLPNVFIVFSATTQIVLVIVTLIIFSVALWIAFESQLFTKIELFKSMGIWLIIGIASMLLGVLISKILSLITGVPFNIAYMPQVPFVLGLFIIFVILYIGGLAYFIHRFVKAKQNHNSLFYGGLSVNALFMMIFVFALPGGTYLFMFPLLLTCLIVIIVALMRGEEYGGEILYNSMESINILFPIILFTPVVYLLYLALTIGALGICLFLIVFPLMIVLPTIMRLEDK